MQGDVRQSGWRIHGPRARGGRNPLRRRDGLHEQDLQAHQRGLQHLPGK